MKSVLRRVPWVLLLVAAASATGAAIFVATATPPPPFSREEVAELVDRLNHEAAIQSPHFSLGKDVRAAHTAVFEAVEFGTPLDVPQSAEYRQAYQSILRNKQWYLALFDGGLTVVHNHRMGENNNVGGKGIAGDHDHHDYSARSNFESLRASIARLEDGDAPGITKVVNAAMAHKDLTDIILHMATAPQTKSTPYEEAGHPDELNSLFAKVMRSFKAAQFAPVNSPEYVRNLHAALGHYDDLVLHVQSRLESRLTRWQRVAAGRWLAWQSFGPDLDDATAGPLGRSAQSAKKGI